jgi:hypothetical protein
MVDVLSKPPRLFKKRSVISHYGISPGNDVPHFALFKIFSEMTWVFGKMESFYAFRRNGETLNGSIICWDMITFMKVAI